MAKHMDALSPRKRELLELLLKEKEAKSRAADSHEIARRQGDQPLIPSFAQQRLWFIDQLEPGSPAYNIPAAVRLTGDLDIARLERAYHEVVRRHEDLRMTFAADQGRPRLVVAPELRPPLPVEDLTGAPESGR